MLSIRSYEPTDEDVVMQLWSRSSWQAHPFVDGEGTGARAQEMREVYLRQDQNYVVTDDGEVIGILELIDSLIGGLFVDPDAQGRDAGRAMIEFAATMHPVLTVDVYERNQRARAFYAHVGFVEGSRWIEDGTGLVHLRLIRGGSA